MSFDNRTSFGPVSPDNFITHIKNEFPDNIDMMYLAEYVIDKVYKHPNEKVKISPTYKHIIEELFILDDNMDINLVKKYNKIFKNLYINYTINNSYILISCWCLKNNINIYVPQYERSRLVDLNNSYNEVLRNVIDRDSNTTIHCSKKFIKGKNVHNKYNKWNYSSDYQDDLEKLFESFNFISCERIREEQDYITYFIANDLHQNQLRKLLILLSKNILKLESQYIESDDKNILKLIDYNLLLKKYCVKLILKCKKFIQKRNNEEIISLEL